MQIVAGTIKMSVVVPQKVKSKTTTSEYLYGEYKTLIWKDMCIPMLIAVQLTTTKIWKQLKCSIMDKKYGEYIKEYYSVIKKVKISNLTSKWMDLKWIIWNDVNQKEKKTYYIISFICGI